MKLWRGVAALCGALLLLLALMRTLGIDALEARDEATANWRSMLGKASAQLPPYFGYMSGSFAQRPLMATTKLEDEFRSFVWKRPPLDPSLVRQIANLTNVRSQLSRRHHVSNWVL